jgi:glutamate---cysteine ligase / carboxylate-amine ligase
MFPRTGIPRHFDDYRDYVAAIDRLLVTGAFPEPTFLWWDVRLQPKLGTLEVRIMDAQTRISDTAALTALVQCLVRLEAMEGWADATVEAPEVVAENHFLAARDGVRAQLLFPRKHGTRPMREWIGDMLAACAPHAAELGCAAELATVATLLEAPGEARQRALASALPGEGDPEQLRELVRALHLDFASSRAEPAALRA